MLRDCRSLSKEEEVKHEISLMQQLNHQNIVKLKHVSIKNLDESNTIFCLWILQVYKTRNNFYLAMELVKDGSL